jgi:quinol monooxygenase YgiN
MICVIATAKAREGSEGELKRALLALAEETHKESGCIQYDIHVGAEDASLLAVYERWESAEALAAHFEEPHTKSFFAVAQGLVAAPPSIVTYTLAE